jgi:L-ascorbate metabolism protein UlaG (beta-lactamase superfamily)
VLLLASFGVTTGGAADKSQQSTITLMPLGTGKGATAVYEGEPSSSFVIKVNGECRLWVDTGLGVSPHVIKACGSVPKNIFISHNHSDHAGELPVLLIVEQATMRKLRVISGPEVNERLVSHRIAELYSTGLKADQIADWVAAPEGEKVKVDDDLSLVSYQGKHSEVSYGFVLFFKGSPVLGFSGDSGFDRAFYQKLAIAPTLVLDARKGATAEHAGFDELYAFEKTIKGRVFVGHYGKASEAPTQSTGLVPGKEIELTLTLQEFSAVRPSSCYLAAEQVKGLFFAQ